MIIFSGTCLMMWTWRASSCENGDVDTYFPAWKRLLRIDWNLSWNYESGGQATWCSAAAGCADKPSAASTRISISLSLGHEDSSCGKPEYVLEFTSEIQFDLAICLARDGAFNQMSD